MGGGMKWGHPIGKLGGFGPTGRYEMNAGQKSGGGMEWPPLWGGSRGKRGRTPQMTKGKRFHLGLLFRGWV